MGSLWHYQIVRHNKGTDEEYLAVHELMVLGEEELLTTKPVRIIGEDIKEIKWTLDTINEDISKHLIRDFDEF